jgi:hypothetical protein
MLAGDRQINNKRVSREGQRSGKLRDDVVTTQALLVVLSLSSSMGVEGGHRFMYNGGGDEEA